MCRMRSGDLKHLVFSVKGFATGDADVTTNGREPHGHVRLPTDSRPFRAHPELIGAIFALEILPLRDGVRYQLER